MCLTTDKPVIKEALNSMIVFKRLSCGFSVHQSFEYQKFVKEPLEALVFDETYSTLEKKVNRGYHSYNNMEACYRNEGGKDGLEIFVIPKGAKYVDGWNNGERQYLNRVSSTIIRIGSVKNPFNWLIALFF